jgi:hypothetical protein
MQCSPAPAPLLTGTISMSIKLSNSRVFGALGALLLAPRDLASPQGSWFARELEYVSNFSPEQFQTFLEHAEKQRVLRRILEVLQSSLHEAAQEHGKAEVVETVLAKEQERVDACLTCLNEIVIQFEQRGHPITVMKTLDHWPDTGSDLDLLIVADDREICAVFEKEFHAIRQTPSWGDRLAHKLNFRIPGLGELVEIHVGCLGQTGEHTAFAAEVLSRRVKVTYEKYSLPVPIPEDKVVIATLQRMYRHYYIRLTDILNIFGLMSREMLDFERLQGIAEHASIWEGVATLLLLVQQYGVRYGGRALTLPQSVHAAAQFSAEKTYLGRSFVRVPLVPQAVNLFLRQFAGNGLKHNPRAMMRLSLLPLLATAAFVSFRITGNDKGIW